MQYQFMQLDGCVRLALMVRPSHMTCILYILCKTKEKLAYITSFRWISQLLMLQLADHFVTLIYHDFLDINLSHISSVPIWSSISSGAGSLCKCQGKFTWIYELILVIMQIVLYCFATA